MKDLAIRSYAKINIGLNVVGRREDGYHDLDMLMVPVELHDSIIMSEIKNTDDNFVTIDDFSGVRIHHNIASEALNLIQKKHSIKKKFRVFIHKVIPIQAGLGGGSSNAAFVLKGVNQLLNLKLSEDNLIALAKELGSDVPFFISCKPVRCRGKGDEFEPVAIKNNYHVIIVKPNPGCLTKEVFDLSDTMNLNTCNIDNVVKALKEGDDKLLAESIDNSLEDPAAGFVPEIKLIKQKLKKLGLGIVSMTGTGSAVFALSTNATLVKDAARKLEDRYVVEVTKILK
ncbi:MAG TPA: 4-(cytidine 5'-diphospho)-2-C-methyl-D-erythritol kinase [Bacilli bacterium]|jgi:4-diphosphocytidyl-2-C-methyl-D-erythritol kinase|nr:4-(cytidine 5'-diphospho)-2-C-methyl-D-erythritol kinase [Bacilli bacterium]HPY79721.1 4-(cytidine 5'-diphospho)-2-C-methyl-D-erythritol kinase [Bacilli bacterium]HQA55638.1 4-(cytidine 5'-diphospho)-2-C-methyl-D-erythritol kinase [Bacilli bacterium]